MLLHLHDVCLQYVPEVALVRTQFHRASADMAAFQRSMQGIAQLLEQNTVAEVLIDMHGLPDLTIAQQLWIATHWLPRVAVPAVQHAAIIIPENGLYNQMTVEMMHRAARHFISCEVQFFQTRHAALDWLLSFQDPTAQLALEQEWNGAWAASSQCVG